MKRGWMLAGLCALIALSGGCATVTVAPVGHARTRIDPSLVRVYVQPPPRYEVLGILDGNAGIEGTGRGTVDDVIRKL